MLAPTLHARPVLAAAADPDLLRLFIEEAGEEQARIARFLPVWDQDPAQRRRADQCRRSFHTLKGSGRVVGARDLAEFAWSVENLLNRLLDSTLSRSPAILETLREAVLALPQLIGHLDQWPPVPRIRHHRPVCPRAMRWLQVVPSTSCSSCRAAEPAAASGCQRLRPKLQWSSWQPTATPRCATSTRARQAAMWPRCAPGSQRPAPARRRMCIPEPVYRACHTLCGQLQDGRGAARHPACRAAQHWLRLSFDSGVGLTPPTWRCWPIA